MSWGLGFHTEVKIECICQPRVWLKEVCCCKQATGHGDSGSLGRSRLCT